MTRIPQKQNAKRRSAPRTAPPKSATVTLRFKSEYAKGFFLAQLSDGWGENHCALKYSRKAGLDRANVIDVSVYSDWGDETHEIEDESTDRQAQRMKRFLPQGVQSDG